MQNEKNEPLIPNESVSMCLRREILIENIWFFEKSNGTVKFGIRRSTVREVLILWLSIIFLYYHTIKS